MKRTELEAKLAALGWFPVGPSGANHVKWAHRKMAHKLYVRQTAILPAATAQRILEEAAGK